MRFRTADDGRWVLGDPNARCRKCDAPAAVTYAGNGRAEVWHPATDCCAWSREREVRFARYSHEDDRQAADARARAEGWPNMGGAA